VTTEQKATEVIQAALDRATYAHSGYISAGTLVKDLAAAGVLREELLDPPKYGCPTPGCPGDGRYGAPGRGHLANCTYPQSPAPQTVTNVEMRHFAPYGSTNALCDETVPRGVAWDKRHGEYADLRFTTRRALTTCRECLWRMGGNSAPRATVTKEQVADALLLPIHDYLCGCDGEGNEFMGCLGDRRGFAEDCASAVIALLTGNGGA
jgi:hypothetical protein